MIRPVWISTHFEVIGHKSGHGSWFDRGSTIPILNWPNVESRLPTHLLMGIITKCSNAWEIHSASASRKGRKGWDERPCIQLPRCTFQEDAPEWLFLRLSKPSHPYHPLREAFLLPFVIAPPFHPTATVPQRRRSGFPRPALPVSPCGQFSSRACQ